MKFENTALLIMDVQAGIIDRVNSKEEYISKVTAAVSTAHKSQIPVIYVVVGFRPGFPEASARNKSFQFIKEAKTPYLIDPQPLMPISGEDLVVVKRRVSAFAGSDLEVVLRSREIHHMVLGGIATSGVVLSTLREAADKDFQITVLSDVCADSDAEVHRVLLEKVFPRQAAVISSEQWIQEAGK